MKKEEKNEEATDSTIEETSVDESQSEERELNPKHRTVALSSLAAGYALALGFGALLYWGSQQDPQVVINDSITEEGEVVGASEEAEIESSVITLTGGTSIPWPVGKLWVDPGYSAIDGDEDLTAFVETVSFVDVSTPGQYKVIYTVKDPKSGEVSDSVERFVTVNAAGFIAGANVAYNDRLDGLVLGDEKITALIGDNDDDIVYVDNDDRHLRLAGNDLGNGRVVGGNGGNGRISGGRNRTVIEDDVDVGLLDRRLARLDDDELIIIDDNDRNTVARLDRKDIGLDRGGNDRVDVGNFVPDARRGNFNDEELGEVGDFAKDGAGFGKGTMPGVGKGSEVYAYNFPSQGIGAGIGSPAVGAAAGFAGLGAGIGQAVMEGEAVPALGGIGTYTPAAPSQPEGPDSDNDGISDAMESSFRTNPQSSDSDKDGVSDADEIKGMSNPRDPTSKPGTPAPGADNDQDGVPASLEALYGLDPSNSDSDGDGFSDGEEISAMTSPTNPASNPGEMGGPALAVAPGVAGGVAGLVGGAGAGAAAGLVSGRVTHPLGLGVADVGVGIGINDGEGVGRDDWDYDHLPKDGNLFIMMHVDGSGSILSTRKALDEMKDTLLKNALLPYYKNDEDLYNRRVLVVDGEGERTLKFFADAAKKENVLALVFQDEAQPAYHLPNFNRKPEDHYMDDLNDLKKGLNGYGGLYRGIMFQVDRGKTFAKSFKEFVENAWRGDGYLSGAGENLKPYYWQENGDNIRNRDGIVFSDEYHVNSEGDPAYYMNLIMDASRKIGLDLGKYGGGQEDGRYNAKVSNTSQNSSTINKMCPVKKDRKANPAITTKNSSGQTIAFCCKGCKNKYASAD
ncbi:MAG: DUF5011 domain-containing protein [Opitutae bacterium]|nr:DUF5011 domain-containing protein [Opitutae bacterium]